MNNREKQILEQYCETEVINYKYLLYYRNDVGLIAIENLISGVYEIIDNNFISFYI